MKKPRRATKTKRIEDTIEYEMGVITAAMADVHALTGIVKRLDEVRPHVEKFVKEFLTCTKVTRAEVLRELRAKKGGRRAAR